MIPDAFRGTKYWFLHFSRYPKLNTWDLLRRKVFLRNFVSFMTCRKLCSKSCIFYHFTPFGGSCRSSSFWMRESLSGLRLAVDSTSVKAADESTRPLSLWAAGLMELRDHVCIVLNIVYLESGKRRMFQGSEIPIRQVLWGVLRYETSLSPRE